MAGRIMSMKNSSDTIGNRNRDLPIFNAVHNKDNNNKDNNNNNNIKLQMGCRPVPVVIMQVHKYELRI
jgi:hypothetical protein